MPTPDYLEKEIGFPPNSGLDGHVLEIENSVLKQASVRPWLELQGIPRNSVRGATVKSISLAYTNRRYLLGWRKRVNPSFDLLGGSSEDDHANDAAFEAGNNVNKPVLPTAPAAPAANAVPTEKWLRDLFAQIEATVNKLTKDKLDNAVLKLDESAKQAIRDLAKQSALDAIANNLPPRVIDVRNVETGAVQHMGQQHAMFPTLLRALQARGHNGHCLNVWLTGPTGSGKTSAAEYAAKALDLKFGADGSLDNDYKVLGFRNAQGEIVSTQFLEIYTNGGIYVADEIDNWLPSALLSLNSALANGWAASPGGLVKRHKDCRVIACANTWGLGATSDYVGRTRLDAASLDRFQPKINWPYDEKLERAISYDVGGDIGLEWFGVVTKARHKAMNQGLKIIVSPRASYNGIALLQAGFDPDEVVDMTFAAGISPEQKRAIGPFVFDTDLLSGSAAA